MWRKTASATDVPQPRAWFAHVTKTSPSGVFNEFHQHTMARLSQAPGASLNRSAIDVSSSELGHLLLRLQQTVLHADVDRERRLRTSEFERARVAAVSSPCYDATHASGRH